MLRGAEVGGQSDDRFGGCTGGHDW
jgi:hypothetical protein